MPIIRKNRYWLAAVSGAIYTTGFSPFFYVPLAVLAILSLLFLIKNCETPKQATKLGWIFGFCHSVLGLYWVCNSLLIEPEKFAWLIPFAISLIPAYVAIYFAIFGYATYKIKPHGLVGLLFASSIWVLLEIARNVALTGFPWNLSGYILNFSNISIQSASIWGIFGQSFIFILICILLYQKKILPVLFAICLCAFIFGFGYTRLKTERITVSDTEQIARVVQPNIAQNMKWNQNSAELIMTILTELTNHKIPKKDLVIWPEAAVPFDLDKDIDARKYIAEKTKSVVVTGAVKSQENPEQYWNSVQVINKNGEIEGFYNKSHLVPFGEYLPFRTILPDNVQKITYGSVDFSTGEGPKSIYIQELGLNISPIICYEAIFSNNVVDKKNMPQLLVAVTNDAWFGNSTGPHQHLEIARTRAVEEGVPLLRSANTGISAIIDGYGEVISSLDYGMPGVISIPLNKLTKPKQNTLFSYIDNRIIYIFFTLLTFILLLSNYCTKCAYRK